MKWMTNEKKTIVFINQFNKTNRSKTPRFRKFCHPSDMQNDAWMHIEGLEGLKRTGTNLMIGYISSPFTFGHDTSIELTVVRRMMWSQMTVFMDL